MGALTDALVAARDELLEQLNVAEVPTTTVPGEVRTPGGWLTIDSMEPVNVAGTWRVECSLYLVCAATDELRALELLGDLLDKVCEVRRPAGPVRAARVVLPSSSTPLPALRVPIKL